MATEDYQDDLTALFEVEDQVLDADADAFVTRVDRGISRQICLRRAVLTSATLVGGAVAGTQAPSILLQLSASGGVELPMLEGWAQQMGGQPFSVFAIGFAVVISTVTLLSQDRI